MFRPQYSFLVAGGDREAAPTIFSPLLKLNSPQHSLPDNFQTAIFFWHFLKKKSPHNYFCPIIFYLKINSPQHALPDNFQTALFFSLKLSLAKILPTIFSTIISPQARGAIFPIEKNISLCFQILHPLILTAYLSVLLFCFHVGERTEESRDFCIAELSETRAYCPFQQNFRNIFNNSKNSLGEGHLQSFTFFSRNQSSWNIYFWWSIKQANL